MSFDIANWRVQNAQKAAQEGKYVLHVFDCPISPFGRAGQLLFHRTRLHVYIVDWQPERPPHGVTQDTPTVHLSRRC